MTIFLGPDYTHLPSTRLNVVFVCWRAWTGMLTWSLVLAVLGWHSCSILRDAGVLLCCWSPPRILRDHDRWPPPQSCWRCIWGWLSGSNSPRWESSLQDTGVPEVVDISSWHHLIHHKTPLHHSCQAFQQNTLVTCEDKIENLYR